MAGDEESEARPEMATTGEIAKRLESIKAKKRPHVRWGIGRHTAELAIRAITAASKRNAKSKRQSRRKRLL